MAQGKRTHPAEFKRRMVELVRAGRNPKELAKEFEPSPNTIRNGSTQAGVDGGLRADGPSTAERKEFWVAEITYIPAWTGFLHLVFVLDVWKRRIVGWSMCCPHLRPSSCWRRLTWPWSSGAPNPSSTTRIRAVSPRPMPSENDVRPAGSARQWGSSGTRTTMPWPSPSSPASSASSWTAGFTGPRPRCAWRSSGTSRGRTTRGAGTRVPLAAALRGGARGQPTLAPPTQSPHRSTAEGSALPSAVPRRAVLTPWIEGGQLTTVPQFSPIHRSGGPPP